jgi:hypothetical protein
MLEFLVEDIVEKIEEINRISMERFVEYLRKKEVVNSDELKTNMGLEKYYSLIYQLGISKQKYRIKEKKEEIIQEFLASDNSYLFYLAGRNWNDYWFDERIRESIIKNNKENNKAEYLYLAGLEWKAKRFSEDIARALAETKDQEYITLALQNWNKTRKNVLQKCIKEYNAAMKSRKRKTSRK